MNYPDDFINKVINGDCLEVMKDIPDKSVDLVVTDPPYNMDYSGRGKVNKFEGFNNDKLDEEEHSEWFSKILSEFYRVLKEDSVIYIWIDFRNYARIYNLVKKLFSIKNCIVWDKRSIGMGQHFRFQHEFCIYAIKGNYKLENHKIGDIWQLKRESVVNYQHPTQKPLGASYLPIKYSSKESDVVLDTFLGSGTTAIAAKQLNRNFIGIEISKDYCKIANERLRVETLL